MVELDEADKQQAQEVMQASRKRSSRLATKESEKEEQDRERISRMSIGERMALARAEDEFIKLTPEELAAQKEYEREKKMREREERAMAREREAYEKAQKEEAEKIRTEKEREDRSRRRIAGSSSPPPEATKASTSKAPRAAAAKPKKKGRPVGRPRTKKEPESAHSDGDWELGCEVCGKRGVNLPDAVQIVCCEQCGVWQHVKCWNAHDRKVGQATRDWSSTDFYCSKCKPPVDGKLPPYPNSQPLPPDFSLPKPKAPRKSNPKDSNEPPKEKKPRAPRKSKDPLASASSGLSTPSSPAAALDQPSASTSVQAGAQFQDIPPQVSPSQGISSQGLPSQAQQVPVQQFQPQQFQPQLQYQRPPNLPSQPLPGIVPQMNGTPGPLQSRPPQQDSAAQPPAANLALGSLPQSPWATNGNGIPTSSPSANGGSFSQQQQLRSPSLNGPNRSSPGTSTSNATAPIIRPRSPGTSFGGLSNQPSGSFPIRRDAPAKSPLSRPYDSPTEIPTLALGRPQSPTPGQSGTLDPALQRGSVGSSSSPSNAGVVGVNGEKTSLYQRQTPAPSPSMSRPEGPGPASGSLARARAPSDPSRQFGPSPPRNAFGTSSTQSAGSPALNGHSVPMRNGNSNGGIMAPPSRPMTPSNLGQQQPSSAVAKPEAALPQSQNSQPPIL